MDSASLLTPERVLRHLQWHVLRRLEGRLQGDYRTVLRGNGTDFLGLRLYEWGDDVRHIDWNVTARMNELYVREFVEDRDLTAWLLLDRSRSMAFGAPERTKELVLAELAGVFGQLLVRGGNRIGAIVYDGDRTVTIPPSQGRHQVLHLLERLLQPVAGGQVTDLSLLLETAARVVRRRSLIVLISDFISEPGWERALVRLTQRHEVVAVQMVDPREYELPDAGLLFAEDAETGEQLLVDSSDPQLRRRLLAVAAERDEAIRHAAAAARVDLHVVSTADDLLAAFARIVARRRRPAR
ncbi:MAG TPA: DUF58 domain-containing protein [Solirubrobacteraceae bacterium]|nr:DUF58 domain-containing protein [Solirubrobacteraceae bacterium]